MIINKMKTLRENMASHGRTCPYITRCQKAGKGLEVKVELNLCFPGDGKRSMAGLTLVTGGLTR